MKKSSMRAKQRNIKSHSPSKRVANVSMMKHSSKDITMMAAPKVSRKHQNKRKFQFKVSKVNSTTRNTPMINDTIVKTKKMLTKGASNEHDRIKAEEINTRLFSFDTFGDATSPTKFISRKCRMDLSKIVSDKDLELFKDNIMSDMCKKFA
jgi:excinuclease UvrABC ATPase subunit